MAVTGAVFRRIDLAQVGGLPASVAQHAEEAALVTFVARCAVAALLDTQEDRVSIAIDADFAHHLEISRFLALAPQAIARAREVAGAAGANGLLEGFAIHEGDHQQPPA